MKTKIALMILFLFGQFVFSQNGARIDIEGQVRNDLVPVENVIVFNANSKTGAVVNLYGFFKIMAKVNDTLVFSSLLFKSKKIVLKANDFIESKLVVNLEVFTNELAEVLVLAQKELIPISGNTQRYVDLKYFDDEKSSPKNRLMPPNGTVENGVDFVRVYKEVLGVLRKRNSKNTDFYKDTSFSEVVMNKVNYSFFSDTLHLKDDEIKLFLIFCENDSKSRVLMQPSEEFKLIDFLITKNDEYKKIAQYK